MTKRHLTDENTRFHPSITTDRIIEVLESDEYVGFCTACGHEHFGCEPDARHCRCESCDERAVYGAEELLFKLVA